MLSRRTLILLSASLGCILLSATGIGFWSLSSWQAAENLKTYIAQLEEAGFTVETRVIDNVKFDSKIYWNQFNDFQNQASLQNVTIIYLDTPRNALYCLCCENPAEEKVTANIFYYNPQTYHQLQLQNLLY